jgi:serine/threonine-protein kinase
MSSSLPLGARLGRYEVKSQLGAGGMGEVYLAQDTKLDRKVALKILPADVAAHPDRMKRFVQEAKAASALNHPNILTIYEIDQEDSGHFIATEFIDGETLRQRMQSVPMKLGEVLDVAAQLASALAAAHADGIVHRDVKPENVMLRRDGIVKVLDFGLAKLTERLPPESVDMEAPTRAAINTEPGVVMGTAIYMSPEQARGLQVDARTDIFSLGVLIYEMIAGRLPFEGSNTNEILASILSDKEPPPLARYSRDAPAELERIVSKALRKEREQRYQTTKDLLLDLQSLKQQLEFEARLERSTPPEQKIAAAIVPEPGAVEAITKPIGGPTSKIEQLTSALQLHRRGVIVAAAAVVVLLALALGYALLFRRAPATTTMRPTEIKSLAVLPLKSLDAGENYLGLGIADAVIRRISQTGELTVRPTSAVRRYLNEDTDALTAARQLNADAVLEGSVQRADDRLRVSVNLLRTADGASLWADNFDMRMTDIFTIQDTVAQQVASRLRLQLDPSQQARLTKRSTSSPIANEFYMKGVYALDQRMSFSKQQREATIDFFKRAIEADPNFALAHAQLAFAYASIAVFYEPTEPVWAERAREEINRAQQLDPQLAETHLARFQLLFSVYEGYQCEAAIRELLSAQQLNPNISHAELGYLYLHIGLEDLAARELHRALEIDPTSEFAKRQTLNLYEQSVKYDEWLAAHQRFFPDEPIDALYFLGKGHLDQAQATIEEMQKSVEEKRDNFHFDDAELRQDRALLFALKGDFHAAEAEIPIILGKHPVKDPIYHHATYDIARVYALEGKSDEAVKWLRETAATGFQPYPMFERDAYLNRIRQAPEFIQFMTEMKAQNEKYRREFGEGVTR